MPKLLSDPKILMLLPQNAQLFELLDRVTELQLRLLLVDNHLLHDGFREGDVGGSHAEHDHFWEVA